MENGELRIMITCTGCHYILQERVIIILNFPFPILNHKKSQRLSSILFITTSAEISRLAASGITSELGLSITSSVTIRPRRTGRQCMNLPLSVTLMCASSMVHDMSLLIILP